MDLAFVLLRIYQCHHPSADTLVTCLSSVLPLGQAVSSVALTQTQVIPHCSVHALAAVAVGTVHAFLPVGCPPIYMQIVLPAIEVLWLCCRQKGLSSCMRKPQFSLTY